MTDHTTADLIRTIKDLIETGQMLAYELNGQSMKAINPKFIGPRPTKHLLKLWDEAVTRANASAGQSSSTHTS